MRDPKSYTRAALIELLPKFCSGKVVDVGAGRAKYRELILQFCSSYITVDNMSWEVPFGNNQHKPDVCSDVADMPFQDGEFDTVICTEVLEHVEDPQKLVCETARILKPGGYLILASGWAAAYHQAPKDYWRFSLDAYELLCSRCQLTIVEVRRQGGLFSLILYFMTRNIDLNTKILRRARKFLGPVNIVLEILAEKLDGPFKTEDAIGHVVVAKKL